jgi:hypothetical protein
MVVPLIIFSSKRTIFEETSKFSVTSKTLKDADKRETNEKKVMYVRNGFEKFVEGARVKNLYKLGLWASTAKRNTDKCVQLLEEQFQLESGTLFRFVLDRQHCSDSQGNRLDRNNLFAGAVIKDLRVIWDRREYGPETTIFVTSSIHEAILQPRNVIYVPDFDGSRKSVDNALARLHLLIEAFSNPNDPKAVTDARDLCDKISRMPGFGFSQSILMSRKMATEFIGQASSELLGKLLSRERLDHMGLTADNEDDDQSLHRYRRLVFSKRDHADSRREEFVRELVKSMQETPDLMHIIRYFIFNVGYLAFLRVNGFSIPDIAESSLNAYDERISITYTRRSELGQSLIATPPPTPATLK